MRAKTLAAAFVLAALAQPGDALGAQARSEYVPAQLIVRFRPAVAAAERAAALRVHHAELGHKLAIPRTVVATLGERADVRAAARAFAHDPRVASASPNWYQHGGSTPGDPLFAKQWSLANGGQEVEGVTGTADADIDAPEAWDRTTGSPAVRVAIVDTGFNFGAPDLAGSVAANPGETGGGREDNGVDDDANGFVDDAGGWDFVQGDNDPSDNYGHGTHVAGIVGARAGDGIGISGVAPRTSLLPVRVLDNLSTGSCADIASGMYYAARAGADVVNLSLGGPYRCPLQEDVIDATPGTLYVIAAMNDGADVESTPVFPCALPAPNIVCVAATDSDDALAGYSNYGARSVDLGAPGDNILSTYLKWGPTETLASDGFETALDGRWVTGGSPDTWDRSFVYVHSGGWALTDSPFGEYGNGTDNFVQLAAPLDMTGRRDCAAIVWVDAMLDGLDPGLPIADQDRIAAEVSTDGVSWTRSGDPVFGTDGYARWLIDLSSLEGRPAGRLRFRLQTNDSVTHEGVALDDFRVICVPPLTDYTGAPDEYGIDWGTSMAAPHVSGVAALILALHPGATPAEVKQRLLETVDPLPALAGRTVTGGRLNAARAVGASAVRPPALEPPAAPPVTSGRPQGATPVDAAALQHVVGRLARRLRATRTGALLRRGAVTARGVAAPGPGSAALVLKRPGGAVVASGTRAVGAAGGYAVTARLTARGRALLRRARRLRIGVALAFAPRSGTAVARSTTVTVRR